MLTPTYSERDGWALEIKCLRESRGWSQFELARAAEVSIASVQKIEAARTGGRSMYNHLIATLMNSVQKKKRK